MNAYINEFEMPEIPEEMIIDSNQLVLKVPILSKSGKEKYIYLAPPSYIEHRQFTKDLMLSVAIALQQKGFIKDDVAVIEQKVSLQEILEAVTDKPDLILAVAKKYLFQKKLKGSCSWKWFICNVNVFQLHRLLTYVVMLPEAVKKNEAFLAQKLNIIRRLQTLEDFSEQKSAGRKGCLRPRF